MTAGLARLSSLVKASVMLHIDEPGLNISSFWSSDEYATGRIGACPHPKSTDGTANTAAHLARKLRYEDRIDGFVQALASTAMSVNKLTLGHEHLEQLGFLTGFPLYGRQGNQTMQEVAQHLTSLTISCEDRYPGCLETSCWRWKAFFASAHRLQSLKVFLSMTQPLPKRWQPQMSVVDHALRYSWMSSLQNLEVIGPTNRPGVIDSQLLLAFLNKRMSSPCTVKLSGVMVTNSSSSELIGRTMTNFLTWIHDNLRLDVFEMSVYRRNEHGAAGTCTTQPCNGSCESYVVNAGRVAYRSELETVAANLGVMLKGDFWDFGEYVMRKG